LIVDDYNAEEEEFKRLNQAIEDEAEETDRLAAEREAIEAAKLAEEQDAKDCSIHCSKLEPVVI
jgi:hypothetical protein